MTTQTFLPLSGGGSRWGLLLTFITQSITLTPALSLKGRGSIMLEAKP